MLKPMAREISHSIVKFTFPLELQVVYYTTNSDTNLKLNSDINVNIHSQQNSPN